MQVNDLRAFVVVVELGSVTRAAARLDRVQSAVSQALSRLQKDLGVVLLTRTPEGMRPTPAGLELAARASVILDLIERTERDIAAFPSNGNGSPAGSMVGTVELGIAASLTPPLLGQLLRTIREREPGITVHAHEGLNQELVTLVSEHRLDLGIVWLPVAKGDLTSHPLGTTNLVAVLPPGHHAATTDPLPLGRLADDAWVSFPPGNPARRWIENSCARVGFAPNVRFDVHTLNEAKALVQAGVGVTLLPEPSVRLEASSGVVRAVAIEGVGFHAAFGYVAHAHSDNPARGAVIDLLEGTFTSSRGQHGPPARSSASAASVARA
jgi:DNA-binding transcriptional LysR family regulator